MTSKKNGNPKSNVPVKPGEDIKDTPANDKKHLGSSNAFEETENPLSRDNDDISDEKLDELLGA